MPLRLNHFVIERSCSIIYSSTWSFAETAASESHAELKLILCLTLAELFFHVEGRTKLMQMKFLFRQEHSQTALVRKPAQWRVESAVIFERLSWHLAFKQQIKSIHRPCVLSWVRQDRKQKYYPQAPISRYAPILACWHRLRSWRKITRSKK